MKYAIIGIIALAVIIFLVSCNTKKKMTVKELGNPQIILSKGNCFGKCKMYDIKIYSDRTITYKGLKNVANMGMHQASISDEQYRSLITLFEAADFKNLEDTYLTEVRDVQTVKIGYSQKEVQYHNRGASDALKNVTKAIDELSASLNWEKM